MGKATVDPRILALCEQVTAKRARAVIDHILAHGSVTNDDLSEMGYTHPPRAIRDVRELGIPIITGSAVSAKTGRRMGSYTFGNPDEIKAGRIDGRRAFSKAFKAELIDRYGARDTITGEALEERYLQIDHRVPYQVAGDDAGSSLDVEDFMLLDASSQRAKSWSCEHCDNWLKILDPLICAECFWAFPEDHRHVAMKQKRRADVTWQGDETAEFDRLKTMAEANGITPADLIKRFVRAGLKG
jgi:hypothetical protein